MRPDRILRYLRYLLDRLIGAFVPVNPRKVVIMTNTRRYTCNPKYIYEELRRAHPEVDVTWVSESATDADYPAEVKRVRLGTFRCVLAVYGAKLWLDNGIAFSNFFRRKSGQVHIQTMHGSLGIKSLDNAVASREKSGWFGHQVVLRESQGTDYLITDSAFEEGVFRRIFWHSTPMKRLGHARTDILFSATQAERQRIRRDLKARYGIPEDVRLVLYGPTYRMKSAAKGVDVFAVDYARTAKALEARFGATFAVLERMHNRTRRKRKRGHENVYNVSDYPDMQELMVVADVAITDYSSWIFDYVVTGRPGFLFALDDEEYSRKVGFCYPLEESPFPVCRSNDELVAAIEAFDDKAFTARVGDFLGRMKCTDDGHAAERAVELIREVMGL